MNFLIDMGVPPTWADFLAGAGHTAVDWLDEGHPEAPDADVMRWAAANDYLVFTADLDAAALLAMPGPGVVLLGGASDLTPAALGFAVLSAIHAGAAALAAGAVLCVDPDPTRLRILSR